MDRRDFLKTGALATVPALMPRLVFAQSGSSGTRDILIHIFMRGGADGLNMVVPYFDSDYYLNRPTLAIPQPGSSGGALDLDGSFGLHPQLASLRPLFANGDLGIVHATGSTDGSRSHFESQDLMEAGNPGGGLIFDGWINRYLDAAGGQTSSPFQAVSLSQSLPVTLRGDVPALAVSSIDNYDLIVSPEEQNSLRQAVLDIYDQGDLIDATASDVLASVDQLKAADPLSIPVENGAVYPDTSFGRALQNLARLIKADLGLEAASVDIDGWDHHDSLGAELPPLCTDFADSLMAFHTDLGARMDHISVIAMTEFGRRVRENGSLGTDHGYGSAMYALGGGVRGNQVITEWPGLATQNLNNGDLEITTDYRSVLSEMLIKRMGQSDLSTVFPDFSGDQEIGLFDPV